MCQEYTRAARIAVLGALHVVSRFSAMRNIGHATNKQRCLGTLLQKGVHEK